MDGFVEGLTLLLTEWGYIGLFIAALLAGSVVPFSSELVMVGLLELGLTPTGCLIAGTLGNTAGGMTCYFLGRLGRLDWIERYLHVKPEKIERMQRFLQGRGSLMAFFAFLPAIGEVISIALGYMRSNMVLTTTAMLAGKLIRYITILYIYMQL